MVFNSLAFAALLVVTLSLYWLASQRFRPAILVVASYIFYAGWDVRFLILIVISTIVDFVVGLRVGSDIAHDEKRRWLMLSIAVNLGILAVFKYYGFFVDSAVGVLEALGFEPNAPTLSVVLPVGISFYTLQTMAYSIDVFRGRQEPTRNFVLFAAFVSFFPQLVAGPIERAGRLLPQLASPASLNWERAEAGGRLFVRGMVLKVVVADSMAPIVDRAFADSEGFGVLRLAVGAIAFGLQVYGDFAGYSAMARGVAKLFGVDLVRNFAEPYLSISVTEFWRRWHMSLSSWLRDYLYIPLGGNRRGSRRAAINVGLVMAIGGLWHGAAWHFVLWGAWQGIWLAAERSYAAPSVVGIPKATQLPAMLRTALVVWSSWVLFRLDDLGRLRTSWSQLLSWPNGVDKIDLSQIAFAGALILALDIANRRREVSAPMANTPVEPAQLPRPLVQGGLLGGAVAALIITSGNASTPFVYFQF